MGLLGHHIVFFFEGGRKHPQEGSQHGQGDNTQDQVGDHPPYKIPSLFASLGAFDFADHGMSTDSPSIVRLP